MARSSSPLQRRDFLKLATAASAALLVSPAWARSTRRHRVIVVGAGFGGLACADELTRRGCDVLVLEARNRIGGRVLSFHDLVPGKVVEGGGELIGANHPTWKAYAKRFDLELYRTNVDERLDAPILIRGKRMLKPEAQRLRDEVDHACELMTRDAAPINADEPWKSANASQLDTRTTAQWINRLAVSDLCRRALHVEFSANNGVATFRQSYLGNLTQVKGGGLEKYWIETEMYRCAGGNARLARELARGIGNGIRLTTPVREVYLTSSSVRVQSVSGDFFEGDDVVLAVPPSTWHNIRFSPPLPRALRPQVGVNVKYLARVHRRFWLTSGLSPEAVADGLVSLTWEATGNQGSDAHGAVLTAFSGGPAAERAGRAWAVQKDAPFLDVLDQLYPGLHKNFARSRFMNWPNELWTGGGYSFPAPGQVTSMGPVLRAGLGRLRFAGEHTCYKFVGYMEGALNSGVRVAKQILASEAAATASMRRRVRIR